MRCQKNEVEPGKSEVAGIICRMHEIPGTAGTRNMEGYLDLCMKNEGFGLLG
jgi:hypothetical protein